MAAVVVGVLFSPAPLQPHLQPVLAKERVGVSKRVGDKIPGESFSPRFKGEA